MRSCTLELQVQMSGGSVCAPVNHHCSTGAGKVGEGVVHGRIREGWGSAEGTGKDLRKSVSAKTLCPQCRPHAHLNLTWVYASKRTDVDLSAHWGSRSGRVCNDEHGVLTSSLLLAPPPPAHSIQQTRYG